MNVLLHPFDTSYETVPFSKVRPKDFEPAIKTLIEEAKKEVDAIVDQSGSPTFENTLEALEYSGMQLDRVSSAFFNLNSAETNPEIQKAAQNISPMLSEFANDIRLNERLFVRIKAVYDAKDTLDLLTEQQTLLEKRYRSFVRNGALLPKKEKEELREIDKQLSQHTLTFGEHVLAETQAYTLRITQEKDLEGLPADVIETAKAVATEKQLDGWAFTLDHPSYVPFMTYANNRELRKEMALSFGSKGFHNDDLDNQQIILQIVKLRHRRAQLLGYETHAHFVLEERMAESPEKVQTFLNELLLKAKPAAERELKELSEFAKRTTSLEQLNKWDGAYFTEKLKQKRFDLDDEKLKPYFPLDQVIDGVFEISRLLYGLHFKEVNDIDVYHKEVKTYEVRDEKDSFTAVLYTDFHPRPGKRSGAWMTSYRPQYKKDGRNERPHISIVCNFTRPTAHKPSLLTFNEVTTLFHEFGHALHGMLADTTYPGLSGTNVHWDFVELPSQIMENWCYQPEALALFARHYETGEIIPEEYVKSIRESANFMEGMATLRQVSFGLLDMSWHGMDPTAIENVKEHEKQVFSPTQLYPETPETCMSTAFSHIFQGGYSSGYYSYKWAEVLDADAFELFREKGVFNTDVADAFREYVLSKGGTQAPMELYKHFRGKEPSPDALLRRAGLLSQI